MRLDSDIVRESIVRARAQRFDPAKKAQRLGEGDRRSSTTAEQRSTLGKEYLAQTGDPALAQRRLERVLAGNDLAQINYLERGVLASRAVCRIVLRNAAGETQGFGTGFMVAPGVVMTNHHVIANAAEARNAIAEFDYELDLRGQEKTTVAFELQADPAPVANKELDFCIAGVTSRSTVGQRRLEEYGWLTLSPKPGKTIIGEYLTIIQHPGGERKQICVRENKLLKYDENGNTLWYLTDTVAGSSGSPVFNNSWQVVALHHSGVPRTNKQGQWLTVGGTVWDNSMDESQIDWIANEGIRISRIFQFLSANFASHPLARNVLATPVSPLRPYESRTAGQTSPALHREARDGSLVVTVPVQIAVSVGSEQSRDASEHSEPPPFAMPVGAVPALDGFEKVDVDQSNYNKRTGYNPRFLGGGSRVVPLPLVTDPALKKDLVRTGAGKKALELKYWTYSVIMNRKRRLAVVTAANVDANQRPSKSSREGDRWYYDSRIAEKLQLGPEFYAAQRDLEADRSRNPFDRGHLVRRLDAQWGANDAIAKRNGDDSFHWTNCSPQHWRFNQGSKRWLGLEDYVIQTFAARTGRACVFNGPVFDAPLSVDAQDGAVIPNLGGKAHRDPTFGVITIPKQFYKIVVCADDDNSGLMSAAFLMSQEDYLLTVDRLKGMPPLKDEKLATAEARLYQVQVSDIEKLTGIDFGPIVSADTKATEARGITRPRQIVNLSDIRL